MRIALVAEGTYPVTTGGVSTWCDQLVRGLPEHSWTVLGLTATGRERPVWSMPPTVERVLLHPLWGPTPAPRWSRSTAARSREAQTALQELWDAALAPDGEESVQAADAALRRLVEVAAATRLSGLLAVQGSTSALLRAWAARCPDLPPMSVADAVAAASLVDRLLAAIDAPLPPVDLVHAAGNGTAALVALVARWRHGTPFLLSEHGVYLRERYLALREARYSWAERRAVTAAVRRLCEVAYREAEHVVPVSDFNRRWEQRLGVDPERVTTIPNGVPPELFSPVEGEPEAPTISFVGRIDPLKDLHTLVRAFAVVHARMPEARLRIFGPVPLGDERYRDSVVSLVSELGLQRVATLEGAVASSRTAIAAGQVVAMSSISEGLPFTLIEAMMCGRPTVSTDVGGVPECLDPERTAGSLVPARNPEAFAEACLELLADPARRRAMGAAARRHALATATADRTLAAYRGLYLEASRAVVAADVAADVVGAGVLPLASALPAGLPLDSVPAQPGPVPRPSPVLDLRADDETPLDLREDDEAVVR